MVLEERQGSLTTNRCRETMLVVVRKVAEARGEGEGGGNLSPAGCVRQRRYYYRVVCREVFLYSQTRTAAAAARGGVPPSVPSSICFRIDHYTRQPSDLIVLDTIACCSRQSLCAFCTRACFFFCEDGGPRVNGHQFEHRSILRGVFCV